MDNSASQSNDRLYIVQNSGNDKLFPFLVVCADGKLHVPLTFFVRFLVERFAPSTVRAYLTAIVAYFSWQRAQQSGESWDSAGTIVRRQVIDYLLFKFKCQIRTHRDGFRMVSLTKNNASAITLFLAAVRGFYTAAINEKQYAYSNPLIDWNPVQATDGDPLLHRLVHQDPRIPSFSGVSAVAPRARLTDSYFVVINNQWTPRVIDDAAFPKLIMDAGAQVKWRARERLVTRLLFETGARVSEVCGLTLGDWHARGLENSATSFSKGSDQRRVKFVRWSSSTSKLLREYFDTVRIQHDEYEYTLTGYLSAFRRNEQELYKVPLFLTAQGNSLPANTYRDLYWRPACRKAQIDADIHQARHWYVTMSIREIYSSNATKEEIERRVNDLIQYMNWKSGRTTLEAYEHFFSRQRHGEIQDALHAKLDQQLTSTARQMKSAAKVPAKVTQDHDPELDFLLRMGGQVE